MATTKFKDDSPYTKPAIIPPEDYLYSKFMSDLELKSNKSKEPIIGIAFFGVGRAGTIHMSNLVNNPRVKLLYVVDDMESKWEQIRSYWRLDNIPLITSKKSDQVFKDPKVDAVVVCSPTFTHEGIVTKALEAGKAVFCEKPISQDVRGTAKCYETSRRVGKPLFCAFNRRFDPSYQDVYRRLRQGEIGHAHIVRLTARDSPIPSVEYIKHSGGIFHDCMVHDIDLMTYMLGEFPIKVSAHASALVPEMKALNDFDTVVGAFHFPSGTVGTVDLSRNAVYGYDQRIEVFGPRGMIDATNEQPVHCVTTQIGKNGQRRPPIWYSFASRFARAYSNEMEHFLDVVLGKAQPRVHEKEVLAVSKIADAVEESARSGKTVDIKWSTSEMPPQRD